MLAQLIIAFIFLIIAGLYDLKYRIIPNYLNFSVFFIGVLFALLNSLRGEFLYLKAFILSILSVFFIGYLFWKLGFWGAGDAKLFLALSSLLPEYPRELKLFSAFTAPYPFTITIMLNTFLVSFPVLFFYAFYLTAMNMKAGLSFENVKKSFSEIVKNAYHAFAFISGFILLGFLNVKGMPFYILLLLIFIILSKFRIISHFLVVSAFLASFYYSALRIFLSTFLIVFSAVFLFKIFWRMTVFVSKHGLYEEISIDKLEEGMILAEDIYREGDEIKIKENVRERVKEENLIAGSFARGLERDEIERIKMLAKHGKIPEKIKIKRSMSFTPVLLGMGISLIFGDIFAGAILK